MHILYLVVPTECGWTCTTASWVSTLYELLCNVEALELPSSAIVEETYRKSREGPGLRVELYDMIIILPFKPCTHY